MVSSKQGKGAFSPWRNVSPRVLLGLLVVTMGLPAFADVTPVSGDLAGDANNDGSVDIADFIILKNNFGATEGATWEMGDFDGNGDVDIADFIILKNNFGATSSDELTLDCGDGVMMELVQIPAGTFIMGSPSTEFGRNSNEGPQHQVTLTQPFYMGVYEVTIGQYLACLNDGADPSGVDFDDAYCPVEPYGDGYRMKTTTGNYWGDLDQPMVEVSWYGAESFCQWLSQRTGRSVTLPTEAQWEYACRAGSTTRFYYGDDPLYSLLGNYAWYWDGTYGTHPVGEKTPNAWGLYDMHGNVFEWCDDWYESYASADVVDPLGPASGSYRVFRGGGWNGYARRCRSAYRYRYSPDYSYYTFGFRVVVAVGGLD